MQRGQREEGEKDGGKGQAVRAWERGSEEKLGKVMVGKEFEAHGMTAGTCMFISERGHRRIARHLAHVLWES